MTYQWLSNGIPLVGATQSSYSLSNVQLSYQAVYSVEVFNGGPSTMEISSGATLTVTNIPPSITNQPQSQTQANGGTATFSVAATGTAPLSYQWTFNGAKVSGATGSSLALTPLGTSNAGSYAVVITNNCGALTSAVANLTVVLAPAISTQPASQSIGAGNNVTFGVAANNSPAYQWNFNGVPIAGATNFLLSLTGVQTNNAGNYTVVLTNIAGSVTSSAAVLTVVLPPTISTQPVSQSIAVGRNASFSVTGNNASVYQWNFNGAPLAGATSSTLALTSVQSSNAGNYSVVLTNIGGSITSAVATLTVILPPTINTQPASQSTGVGRNTTFEVSGNNATGYQWNFNGAPLAGATTSTLSLTGVQTNYAGNYSVVLTNIAGSVTSAVASLTVIPNFALSSATGAMNPGGFTFEFTVPTGRTYVISASTDLMNWAPIATNVASNANVSFTDTTASSYRGRFYRVVAW